MTDEIKISIKIEEANLILSALGNLPFIQVHELFAKIQNQATEQLAKHTSTSNGSMQNIDLNKTVKS